MIELYVFIIGSLFGSFYAVLGERVEKKESILTNSQCPNCNNRLKLFELFPIFSYLLLRGKCRHCKSKIPPLYFFIEVITGLFTLLLYLNYGFTIEFIIGILLLSLLVITSVSDIYYKLIPDIFFIIFGVSLLVLRTIYPYTTIINTYIYLFSALGFFVVLTVLATKALKKPALGGADIKLFTILGFTFGLVNLFLTVFISSFIGLIYGLIMREKLEDGYLPFIPFIALASMITYIYGESILDWYLGMFI